MFACGMVSECVCVCVCARARVCVCVCVCMPEWIDCPQHTHLRGSLRISLSLFFISSTLECAVSESTMVLLFSFCVASAPRTDTVEEYKRSRRERKGRHHRIVEVALLYERWRGGRKGGAWWRLLRSWFLLRRGTGGAVLGAECIQGPMGPGRSLGCEKMEACGLIPQS